MPKNVLGKNGFFTHFLSLKNIILVFFTNLKNFMERVHELA